MTRIDPETINYAFRSGNIVAAPMVEKFVSNLYDELDLNESKLAEAHPADEIGRAIKDGGNTAGLRIEKFIHSLYLELGASDTPLARKNVSTTLAAAANRGGPHAGRTFAKFFRDLYEYLDTLEVSKLKTQPGAVGELQGNEANFGVSGAASAAATSTNSSTDTYPTLT